MIFKGKNAHFSAQETPEEKIPTDQCSLKQLSSSVVSGNPNSDCNHLHIHHYFKVNQDDFKEKKCTFYNPRNTWENNCHRVCSLKKLCSSVVLQASQLTSNYKDIDI